MGLFESFQGRERRCGEVFFSVFAAAWRLAYVCVFFFYMYIEFTALTMTFSNVRQGLVVYNARPGKKVCRALLGSFSLAMVVSGTW